MRVIRACRSTFGKFGNRAALIVARCEAFTTRSGPALGNAPSKPVSTPRYVFAKSERYGRSRIGLVVQVASLYRGRVQSPAAACTRAVPGLASWSKTLRV